MEPQGRTERHECARGARSGRRRALEVVSTLTITEGLGARARPRGHRRRED
ncbi:Uncharacterised protein [Streptococcus pyogenes]|nr:Uncharacterised protein [Streptococcus pyogenes]